MHAIGFYFMVYNFSSIRTTLAMASGVADFVWSIEAIVLMTDTNG